MPDRRSVNLVVNKAGVPEPRQKFRSTVPAADVIKAMLVDAVTAAKIDHRDYDTPEDFWEIFVGDPDVWRLLRQAISRATTTMPYSPTAKPGQNPTAEERAAELRGAIRNAFNLTGEVGFGVGPVEVAIDLFNPRPKSRKGTDREWDVRHNGDVDNFAKTVCDALNELAYDDDRQVCRLVVNKVICAAGEEPTVRVTLSELSPDDLEHGELTQ